MGDLNGAVNKVEVHRAIEICRKVVFGSKWILVPFYLGLVFAQIMYAIKFCGEMVHLTSNKI